ncbi:type III-B CRISPR module RAMP protein Cmr1 [Parageobacillus thermoglucosidasius]|uniref:type III-B CRISPR module RAMP protein Cmr1 n=2 Tax=Parageobacillus thermoglucosidasius TaxID=1426 RepID=UPI000B571AC7|nr:type III-B CRISPR module RAMP protein Cmr1 [Parageobacillus thermoglucosidasius]MBY6269755.1 type III-B CRISPR module RAMP protein Cmr1 [Parageobacillus thermoglucosidasius]MED4905580.1 type III-B CRISPR module RAMP protein Cmr1 [Parageobacillus thermoglucosidasius]MED4981272.1 type III-B CRISPR module RAMP protein Cmr1 [Parageobacillus thermoglucosidasius]OUM86921.1 MAG: type III-B CRISPR module RAMP protein Cmr1 [Parageobacillus thermoglucosidasius]RDE23766.1 type III-B CRISPR module RAMP
MQKREYMCEVITPMMTFDAEKSRLEIRATSIKGIMRYWWRALNGHLPPENLRKKEGEFFGESGTKKSPLTIRTLQKPLTKIEKTKLFLHIQERTNVEKICFPPKYCFKVIFHARENIELYDCLFKITLLLGGIGTRSRRGFGSVTIRNAASRINSLPADAVGIERLLRKFYEEQRVDPPEIMVKDLTVNISFNRNNSFPYIQKIEIGKQYDDAEQLLSRIAESSKKHKSIFTGFAGSYRIAEKSHNHSRRNKEIKLRFASPIVVSAIEDEDQKLRPIITSLKTVVPPEIDLKREKDMSGKFKEDILK